ncbi:Crp/Fnr family transcriptional regulator [Chitinimonas sp.]|uniref:Crp/Fnr family transcriptional regulator n=1 Tax=Chitinimonas sp. TaxID=1934313 RepID=UPI0035B449B1
MNLSPAAIQVLRDLLARHGEVSEAQLAVLASAVSEHKFSKGDIFLAAGNPARLAALVVSGLMGEFYLLPDGSRKAKWLARPGSVFGSLEDLVRDGPSRTQIEGLSDGVLLCMPYSKLRDLALREPVWTAFTLSLIESLYQQKSEREYTLLMLDAAARYAWFREQFGSMAGQLSQEIIASYLGISAVHLSRVRNAR